MFTAIKRLFTVLVRPRLVGVAILLLDLTTAPAVAQTTGNATMNAALTDILQLVVNNNSVTLNYATVNDYINGVSATVTDQFTVTSNRPWGMTVQTTTANLTFAAGTIPVSNILVGANVPAVTALSVTPQSLLATQAAAIEQKVTMNYRTAARNAAFLKPAGTYVTTMTFTIAYN